MPDFAFGHGDVVKFLGVLQVLPADGILVLGQQEVEIVRDGGEGYGLDTLHEGRLRLFVAHRFDASFPLLVVHAEDGLRQRQADGDAHELIIGPAPQLAVEVERGIQLDFAARQRDVLGNRDFAIQS